MKIFYIPSQIKKAALSLLLKMYFLLVIPIYRQIDSFL